MKPWKDKRVIGNATLYLGDCLEILPHLQKVDAVITDPKYGVDLEYIGQSDSLEESTALAIGMIDACADKCRVLLTTVGRYAMEIELYRKRPPKWRLCWRKGITSRPCAVGFTDWEPIFVYGPDVHRHTHDLFTAQPEKMGTWGHPCPKSVAWAKWLVGHFTASGETVIDPFMGSGTTGHACMELSRSFIGIEIEPKYYEIACERITNAQRQEKLFA